MGDTMSDKKEWVFPLVIGGEVFQSVKSLAIVAGIKYCCAHKRKARGATPEEVLHGKQKAVVNGG